MNADVVLGIGVRFNDLNTAGWTIFNIGTGKQKLVHMDIDSGELGRVYPAEVGIVTDARLGLEALGAKWQAGGHKPKSSAWLKQIDGWRRAWLEELKSQYESAIEPLHYARIVKDTSDAVNAFDPETAVVCDTGFIMNYITAFYTMKNRHYSTNNHQFGQMGFAPPGLIGAKLARPEHPVVAFVGDQSFIHTGLSLATATEYGIPGVVIVLNNKTIQAEIEGAQRKFGRGVGDHYKIEETGELWNPDIGEPGARDACRGLPRREGGRLQARGGEGAALGQAVRDRRGGVARCRALRRAGGGQARDHAVPLLLGTRQVITALDALFRPRSVAVIGASNGMSADGSRKLGTAAFAHLVEHRFAGALLSGQPDARRRSWGTAASRPCPT